MLDRSWFRWTLVEARRLSKGRACRGDPDETRQELGTPKWMVYSGKTC